MPPPLSFRMRDGLVSPLSNLRCAALNTQDSQQNPHLVSRRYFQMCDFFLLLYRPYGKEWGEHVFIHVSPCPASFPPSIYPSMRGKKTRAAANKMHRHAPFVAPFTLNSPWFCWGFSFLIESTALHIGDCNDCRSITLVTSSTLRLAECQQQQQHVFESLNLFQP